MGKIAIIKLRDWTKLIVNGQIELRSNFGTKIIS